MESFADYVREYERLQHDKFAAEYPHAFLLHRCNVGEVQSGRVFETVAFDSARVDNLLKDVATADLVVLPVAKRPGGLFPDRISVGRTRSSDVHLNYSQVSKCLLQP